MNLTKKYLTKNDCYKAGLTIAIKGLMIHSIGCPQPDANKLFDNFNKTNYPACVHAFIDADGNVLQTLPWNYRGWHCGKNINGSGNNMYIGVEMTEPSTIQYTSGANFTDKDPVKTKAHVLATYNTAVELFAYLCKEYNLDPLADGVILSHSEGHKRGISSNHADVEHLWSKFGLTMTQFRKDIKAKMQPPVQSTPEPSNTYSTVRFNLFGDKFADIKGMIIDGVTHVQARHLLETMGFEVGWDEKTKTVEVKQKGSIDVSSEELTALQKIVHAEAGGEDRKGKVLVANVILNRVSTKGYPNTIKDVIFEPNQFTPTQNGAFEKVIPSQDTIAAVQEALSGVDYSQGALFFCSLASASKSTSWHEKALCRLFVHGGHVFYK